MSDQFEYDVFLSHASADKPAVRELAGRTSNVEFRSSTFGVGCSTFSAVTLERHTALFRDSTSLQRRFIPMRLTDRMPLGAKEGGGQQSE